MASPSATASSAPSPSRRRGDTPSARIPCYTDPVPTRKHNLTLTLDDDLLAEARKIAIDQRTSVNQLVRDFLTTLVAGNTGRAHARKELKKLMRKGLYEPTPITWTRDELHER